MSSSVRLLIAEFFLSVAVSLAQSIAPTTMESPQQLAAKLTSEQRRRFDDAMEAFNGHRYGDALTNFNQLVRDLPGDALLSKFAAECALNTGDQGLALKLVKPISEADPNDWQAAGLLARACAESGDTSCRESGMRHMLDLYQNGFVPHGVRDYRLENIKVGGNTLEIRASLEPWGVYKVYYLGRLSDPEGKIFFRITLESNDADQGIFAKMHPREAADGVREFSLDGYTDGLDNNRQRVQTHSLYKFFVGQPSYETVRTEFVSIAKGTRSPSR